MTHFQIRFQQACVEVFPLVLDFMYSNDIEIDDHSALPLLRLSGDLMMRGLYLAAGDYVASTLSPITAPRYLLGALTLELDTVHATSLALMAAQFESYAASAMATGGIGQVLAQLPVVTISEILSHDRLMCSWESMSHWVKRYCQEKRAESTLDSSVFDAITAKITRVHRHDALYLLQCSDAFDNKRILELSIGQVSPNLNLMRLYWH